MACRRRDCASCRSVNIEAFMAALSAQAIRNDAVLSKDEQNILSAIKNLGKDSAYDVYVAVLRAAYKDKKITADEEDLMRMARDVLKISHAEHLRALTELEL